MKSARQVNPGFLPREAPRYCVRCLYSEGHKPPSPRLRLLALVRQGISIPQAILFQGYVLLDQDMSDDGTRVHFIGVREGAYAWFLREKYQCDGSCKSFVRALTIVSADEAHPLYSVFTDIGAVEVEIAEVTRKQSVHSHYPSGTPAHQIVKYLRSMSEHVGYRRLR